MKTAAENRKKLRPHGIISTSCRKCIFFNVCGGIEPEQSLLDCFQLCPHDCKTCDLVCPYNSQTFFSSLVEINGLRFDNAPYIQQKALTLPTYIPMIYHAYKRDIPLESEYVAIKTYHLFHIKNGKYVSKFKSGDELRKAFLLEKKTKIILSGIDKDKYLEAFWSYRRRDNTAEELAKLDIEIIIGPNFSHFLDVPRTDNLFNRKRQLICLGEFQGAGLCAAPHLNACAPADWQYWKKFLLDNYNVTYVAFEFQTGNKNKIEGVRAIEQLAWLQNEVGRFLHPIIIGGSQYLREIADNFSAYTFIDAKPFMKAVNRQICNFKANRLCWKSHKTLSGYPLDDLIFNNVQKYTGWIEMQCKKLSAQKSHRKRKAI